MILMTLLLLLWVLADPGGRPCKREPGRAQCITVERRHEKAYRCRASCYVPGRADGGVYPSIISAEKESENACVKELDRQASNGCRP